MQNKIYTVSLALFVFLMVFPTPVSACILWQTAEFEDYSNKTILLGIASVLISWISAFIFFKKHTALSQFGFKKLLPALADLIFLISVPILLYYFTENSWDPFLPLFIAVFSFVVIFLPLFFVHLFVFWALRKISFFKVPGLVVPAVYIILIPLSLSAVAVLVRILGFPFTGDVYIPCPGPF
jgi:hypothetical protein